MARTETLEKRVERVVQRLCGDGRLPTAMLAEFLGKAWDALPESERQDSDKLDDLLRVLEMETRRAAMQIADTWKIVRDLTFHEKVLDQEERQLMFDELARRGVTEERMLRVRSDIIEGLIDEFRDE